MPVAPAHRVELFGHEAGAFTGAVRQRRGVFEQASGGTLLLDEIGELPFDLQAKLLRVLEGHSFRRLGGERSVGVDVRLVCATNRDLGERVRAGAFRADLYERLAVFEIALPPLRERRGDIARLAQHFVAKLAPQLGFRITGISHDALEALEGYDFPGNVRELRNLVERAIVLASEGQLERRHFPLGPFASRAPYGAVALEPKLSLESASLDEVIRQHVLRVYESTGMNVTRSAQLLGVLRLALRKRRKATASAPARSPPTSGKRSPGSSAESPTTTSPRPSAVMITSGPVRG